jgi:hypothetical protein
MLRIPVDKVCTLIALARETLGMEPAEESEPAGGGFPLPSSEEYEEAAYDPLFDYADSLNTDELADLLALSWLGRGDVAVSEWQQAVEDAETELSDGDGLAELLQHPTLPDDLEAGLDALGYACGD